MKTLIGETSAVLEKGLQLAFHLQVPREEDHHAAEMIAEVTVRLIPARFEKFERDGARCEVVERLSGEEWVTAQ